MADVLIMGGGVIGLAIALELASQGAQVTLVERNACGQGASVAAAGMLAPEAEQLTGALRDFGIKSRSMYPAWIQQIQARSGQPCGYWCCGILAPVFEVVDHPQFLDRRQALQQQPELGDSIAGGLWFPDDGQVDSRRLMESLLSAARSAGVSVLEGTQVHQIAYHQDQVTHLDTSRGNMSADHYVLATGAWSKTLLPLPVAPRKGQMLALFDPQRRLQRVLFSPRAYIVPRQDGTIVVGATVEDVEFLPGNTAGGIRDLLHHAIEVLPFLADLVLQSTWWGFRPHAPAEIPLLGASPYQNLFLATGHYRNGILFAPLTAKLLSLWIQGKQEDSWIKDFRSLLGSGAQNPA